jgi:hypothetical protein
VNDEDGWPRQLLVSLGALVAAALVIGGVIGMVALGAAKLAGVGSSGPAASGEPSLYIPAPSTTSPAATATTPSQPPADPEPADRPRRKPRITLTASPSNASTFERIYLRGRYRGGNGATLQVQRFDGGWSDFPVSTTVRNGRFETYVLSGRGGVNRFRVVDESTGRTSRPVSVTLR